MFNDYVGVVVIVSYDCYMLEMIVDWLVLVDSGIVKDFDGLIDDYICFVFVKDLVLVGKGGGVVVKGGNKKD